MSPRVLKAPEVVITDDAPLPEAVRAAIEDAFDTGRSVGREEGTRSLAAAIEQLTSTLARTAEDLRRSFADSVARDAMTLTALAADLAAWFTHGVVRADRDALLASIQGALTAMTHESDVTLELNPSIAALLDGHARLTAVAVRSDDTLEPADFRLTGDATTIERCWREAIDALSPELAATISHGGSAHAGQSGGPEAHDAS